MDDAIATLNERVSRLEGWKDSQEEVINSIREDLNDIKVRITHLDSKTDNRIMSLEEKFDNRIMSLEEKFDNRIMSLEEKFDNRIMSIEKKVNTHFRWIVGIQVVTFVAIVGLILPFVIR
ncbi:hypothetical protein JXI42_00665 [bacterium]|nr:hypothetical protein [bacterium]